MTPADASELRYWIRLTLISIVATIAGIDLALLARYGREGTVSYVMTEWCRDWPILPYLIAFGCGAFVAHILTR